MTRGVKDRCALWIAIHLPRRVRYWATMQIIGEAMTEKRNVAAIPLGELFRKIEPSNRKVRETLHTLEELGARSERTKR